MEISHRILPAAINHVEKHFRPFNMAQELQPQSSPVMRTFNEAGNVRNNKRLPISLHHAEDRLKRCERIVGHFRPSSRNGAQQRGLSRIRQAHDSHVG